jgi:hypothetical protein
MEDTPVTDRVFEVVDATSDEQYWTLGIFPTLPEALAALDGCTPDDLPGDHGEYDDFCQVEIRERKFGWGGTGKAVCSREWAGEHNDAADEYVWRLVGGRAPL